MYCCGYHIELYFQIYSGPTKIGWRGIAGPELVFVHPWSTMNHWTASLVAQKRSSVLNCKDKMISNWSQFVELLEQVITYISLGGAGLELFLIFLLEHSRDVHEILYGSILNCIKLFYKIRSFYSFHSMFMSFSGVRLFVQLGSNLLISMKETE